MTAFDKNSVQVDHAYTIDPGEQDVIPLQACPRCGELAPRKHRSTCMHCKRRIPPMPARQGWEPKVHNPFAEISPLVVREKVQRDVKFNRIKGASPELMRVLRKLGVTAAVLAVALAAVPFALNATLGEGGVDKVKAEISYILSGLSPSQQIAQVPHKTKS